MRQCTNGSGETRAVLWDLDGTLLDSAECHWLAWHETMLAAGLTFTREDFQQTFGQRNDSFLPRLLGPNAGPADVERVSNLKEECYRRLIRAHGAQLLPGAAHWLTALRAAGWRQALASSAPRLNIEAILSVLRLADCFETIVGGEDVRQGKPDPQVFLLAADRLGVSTGCCVVVEDSPAGVEGARRAGMRSIGVGAAHQTLPADCCVASLTELVPGAFDRLLET